MQLFNWQCLSCDCCMETANVCFGPVDRKFFFSLNAFNVFNTIGKSNNYDLFERFGFCVSVRHPYTLHLNGIICDSVSNLRCLFRCLLQQKIYSEFYLIRAAPTLLATKFQTERNNKFGYNYFN